MPTLERVHRHPLKTAIVLGALLGASRLLKYSTLARELGHIRQIRILQEIAEKRLKGEAASLWQTFMRYGPVEYYGRFLQLIDQHELLPVIEAYAEDVSEIDTTMPLFGIGLEEEEAEEWQVAFLIITHLFAQEVPKDTLHGAVCKKHGVELCDRAGSLAMQGNGERLEEAARRRPWQDLPIAVAYALHRTGNEFTDYPYGGLMDLGWTPAWTEFKDINRLWKAAKKIFHRATRLANWVEKEPAVRIPALVDILEKACGTSPDNAAPENIGNG